MKKTIVAGDRDRQCIFSQGDLSRSLNVHDHSTESVQIFRTVCRQNSCLYLASRSFPDSLIQKIRSLNRKLKSWDEFALLKIVGFETHAP